VKIPTQFSVEINNEDERDPPDDEDRDPFDGVLDDEIPF